MATSIRPDPAVEKHLHDLKDFYLASATLQRVRKGEEAIHTAEAVRRDLDLDD